MFRDTGIGPMPAASSSDAAWQPVDARQGLRCGRVSSSRRAEGICRAGVYYIEASHNDAHTVLVQVERAAPAGGLRRHGVPHAFKVHDARRAKDDWKTKRE